MALQRLRSRDAFGLRPSGGIGDGAVLPSLGALLVLVAAGWLGPAQAAAADVDINELAQRVAEAVAAEPALAGGWLAVEDEEDDTGATRAVFSRTFADGREAEQSAAMDRIVARLAPAGAWRLDPEKDRHLPHGRIVEGIRDVIRTQPRFTGCELLGIGYEENTDTDSLTLVPRFRVARKGQFDALLEECHRLMAAEPAWDKARISLAEQTKTQMVLVEEKFERLDANKLMRQIASAVEDVPELRGTWLDVELDDQGHPDVAPTIAVFRRAFDVARVGPQSAAVEALVRRLVPGGRFHIDTARDVKLPLTPLLHEVNRIMDLEPGFGGCVVTSASYRYDTDRDGWDLVLQGRLWKAEQAEAVFDLCARVMKSQPAWRQHGIGILENDTSQFVVIDPNPAVAAHHYSEALHLFWQGDYPGADHRLSLASLDAPDNLVYRYWRVIAELAAGDETLADDRLGRTIRGLKLQRHSLARHEVLRSIYRIQGPLRLALLRAEDRALVAMTTRADQARLQAAN